MTHHDYQCLQEIQCRWQKEQQLIRQKFQIPYNMIYTSQQCHNKSISIPLQTKSLFKHNRIIITHKNIKRKIDRIDKDDFNIPPMYCSKCYLNLTKCLCENGIGQWWINLNKISYSTDKILKERSLSNSIPERHISSDTSIIDLSSIKQIKSTFNKHLYVLLDWNNRQSLLNFIQTTQLTKNFSNMTVEQLHQLIIHNNYIHIFNSINDLILTMNKEQQQQISLCSIYIDSTLENINPLSQSHLIADNINLNRTLYGIQKIAILLGVKIDQHMNKFSHEKLSTKQRISILNQQSLLITSKISQHSSIHIH